MRITIDVERLKEYGLSIERSNWEHRCVRAVDQLNRLFPSKAGTKPDAYGIALFELLHVGVRPEEYCDCNHVRRVVIDASVAYTDFVIEHISGYERVRTGPKSSERVFRKGYLLWYDHYREALLLALLARDNTSIERLTRWLDDDVVFSEGTWNVTQEDNLFHKLLAKAIRSGGRVSDDDRVSLIVGGKARHAKMMFTTWAAIEAGDSAAVSITLDQLIKYHRKKFEPQRRKSHTVCTVDTDASIMFHLAARRGIELRAVESCFAYLMTMESLCGGVKRGEE